MLGNNSSTPSVPHHSQISSLNSELLGFVNSWLNHSCLNLVLGYRKEIRSIRGLISRLLFQGHRGADTGKPDAHYNRTSCPIDENDGVGRGDT